MNFRLRSQANPGLSLTLTSRAWRRALSLAEDYGWNPMGTVTDEEWVYLVTGVTDSPRDVLEIGQGSYTPHHSRAVFLEDALNLADALDRAFLAYHPLFIPAEDEALETEWDWENGRRTVSVGVILAVSEICQAGKFWIECD